MSLMRNTAECKGNLVYLKGMNSVEISQVSEIRNETKFISRLLLNSLETLPYDDIRRWPERVNTPSMRRSTKRTREK